MYLVFLSLHTCRTLTTCSSVWNSTTGKCLFPCKNLPYEAQYNIFYYLLLIGGQNVCFHEITYISMKFCTTFISFNWNGELVIVYRGNFGWVQFFVCFGDSYRYAKIKAVKIKCHIILQWKLYQDCEETMHRKFVCGYFRLKHKIWQILNSIHRDISIKDPVIFHTS